MQAGMLGRWSGTLLGSFLLILSGCDSTDCTLADNPAVRVAVVDAASGEPLEVEPSGVIREGVEVSTDRCGVVTGELQAALGVQG